MVQSYYQKYTKYYYKLNQLGNGLLVEINFILDEIQLKENQNKNGIIHFLHSNKFYTDGISYENFTQFTFDQLKNLVVFKIDNIIKEIYFLDDIQTYINNQWYMNPGIIMVLYDYKFLSESVKQKLVIPKIENIKFINMECNFISLIKFNYVKYFMPSLYLLHKYKTQNERILYYNETPETNCPENLEIDNLLKNAELNILRYSKELFISIYELNFDNCIDYLIKLLNIKVGPYIINNNSYYGFFAQEATVTSGYKVYGQITLQSNIGNFMFNVGGLIVCILQYFLNNTTNLITKYFDKIYQLIEIYSYNILHSTFDGLTFYYHIQNIANYINSIFQTKFIYFKCIEENERCSRGIIQYECSNKNKIIIITNVDNQGIISPESQEDIIINAEDEWCNI